MTPFRAVLFDLDGTLCDTAPDLMAALNHVLVHENQLTLTIDAVRPVASNGARGLLSLGFGESQPEDIFNQRCELLLSYYASHIADQTVLFEGMETLLTHLDDCSVPWGVVTNKPHSLTCTLLEKLNLLSRSKCVISGDSLTHRKPHPEPLLHAASLISVDPNHCCYVGDAKRDIDAAKAAGMTSVAALYGYVHPNDDPKTWAADAYVNSLNALYTFVSERLG